MEGIIRPLLLPAKSESMTDAGKAREWIKGSHNGSVRIANNNQDLTIIFFCGGIIGHLQENINNATKLAGKKGKKQMFYIFHKPGKRPTEVSCSRNVLFIEYTDDNSMFEKLGDCLQGLQK